MTHPAGIQSSSHSSPTRPPIGRWRPGPTAAATDPAGMASVLGDLRSTVFAVQSPDGLAVAADGTATLGDADADGLPLLAVLPPLTPDRLGDAGFLAAHNVQYPYMTGAMANGIASVEIVEAIGQAGMLGSFGAAGLSVERVAAAVDRLKATLGDRPFAVNLIHSPGEPAHEAAVADLLLRKGVERVEASAYLDLSPAIVRYRVAGLAAGPDGTVVPRNRVIAKVSRVEVATRFLSPPPERTVAALLRGRAGLGGTGRVGEAGADVRRPDRRGRQRRAHRQPPGDHTSPDPVGVTGPVTGPVRLPGPAAGRAGRGDRHADGRGGRVQHGGGLRRHRVDQPGVRRVGQLGRGPANARRRRPRPTWPWPRPRTCSRWA